MTSSPAGMSVSDSTGRTQGRTPLPRSGQPREPQFVGPTRSAFSFNIAQAALNNMGISTDQNMSAGQSSNTPSREQTPGPITQPISSTLYSDSDCLLSISEAEIARLIRVYQDEVISCHPIIDAEVLGSKLPQILELTRNPDRLKRTEPEIDSRDIHVLRIVVATAITTEPGGKTELCTKLIVAVEQNVGIISSTSEVELKDIQIMAMLACIPSFLQLLEIANTYTEHLLLPHRRRAILLAFNRPRRPSLSRNGSSPKTEPPHTFQRPQHP